jgi:hypothetical protein
VFAFAFPAAQEVHARPPVVARYCPATQALQTLAPANAAAFNGAKLLVRGKKKKQQQQH